MQSESDLDLADPSKFQIVRARADYAAISSSYLKLESDGISLILPRNTRLERRPIAESQGLIGANFLTARPGRGTILQSICFSNRGARALVKPGGIRQNSERIEQFKCSGAPSRDQRSMIHRMNLWKKVSIQILFIAGWIFIFKVKTGAWIIRF